MSHATCEVLHIAAGRESAVVTIAPLMHQAHVAVAVIGLSNMLNCGGAVLACHLSAPQISSKSDIKSGHDSGNGKSPVCQLQLSVKGHGNLMLYSNKSPSAMSVGGRSVQHTYDIDSGELSVTLQGDAEELQHQIVIEW